MRRFTLLLAAAVLAAVLAQTAHAAGGSYTFAGGTPRQQATVRSALSVSTFDWNVLPAPVVVHIAPIGSSYSEVGHVYLDSTLLDSGRVSPTRLTAASALRRSSRGPTGRAPTTRCHPPPHTASRLRSRWRSSAPCSPRRSASRRSRPRRPPRRSRRRPSRLTRRRTPS